MWQSLSLNQPFNLLGDAMTNSLLIRRVMALEATDDQAKMLPSVVDDKVTDAELDRLRQRGREVYRRSDPAFYDLFI